MRRLRLHWILMSACCGCLATPAVQLQTPVATGDVYRLHSVKDGAAFPIYTQDRTIYLLTSTELLGDDPRQAGGVRCELAVPKVDGAVPCKVAYLYTEINLVVLRADFSQVEAAIRLCELGDSDGISGTHAMSAYTLDGASNVASTTVALEGLKPPFRFTLKPPDIALGSPVLQSGKVVGIVNRLDDGQPSALISEAARLALSNEVIFRKLWK